jgi:acyl-coenzyme A synthetase/AMP-(fatty) acid ligase
MIATHPAVAECAVITRGDDLKGQMPKEMVVIYSWAVWQGSRTF